MRRRADDDLIIRELSEEEKLQNMLNGSTPGEDEDQSEMEDNILFTVKMRAATRKVHSMSDALVNAKLGIAMSDDKVWAEGLLVFYEIFKFLETALVRLSPKNSHFKKMGAVIQDIQRTTAFEEDLEYYYGKNFTKTYTIRPSVGDYLKHLKTLEEREPLRLLAYVYHLYMGLLSGGQILKRKKEFRKKLKRRFDEILGWLSLGVSSRGNNGNVVPNSKLGNAVTSFAIDGRTINDIKKEIAFTMNDIAADLSKDEKESLISESLIVFQRNNEIVASIQRTGLIALKNLSGSPVVWVCFGLAVVVVLCYAYLGRTVNSDVLMDSGVAMETPDPLDTVDPLIEAGEDGFLE